MKKLIASLALSLSAIAAMAQGTNDTRTPGEFNGVRSVSPLHIELTQGDACSVTIEAEDNNAAKSISTNVENGVLVIKAESMKGIDDDTKVKVTLKKLNYIDVSGATEVTSSNQLITDSLTVIGTGAAQTKLNVQATSVNVRLSGACESKLTGTASRLDAVLSGACELKAYNLQTERATVVASGASSAHVSASQSINATANGASDITYQGTPAEKVINANGSSSVSMRNADGSSTSDTTNIHVGPYNFNITENDDERSKREKKADDEDFKYWGGFDVGINGYLNSNNQLDFTGTNEFMNLNYAKSYMFGWNAFQKNIHIYRNNVNLGTGIGLTWYHYNFRNSYTLQPQMPAVTAINDSMHYSRNRLNMCYVNVPLFLEFNTNNDDASRSFHIGAGMQFGYNVFNNKLKQKYELDGHTYKRKVKDDFNVNPFRYDAIVRIGYGKFSIFGTYSLSTLFEKEKGPTVYPFAAGIHLDF